MYMYIFKTCKIKIVASNKLEFYSDFTGSKMLGSIRGFCK